MWPKRKPEAILHLKRCRGCHSPAPPQRATKGGDAQPNRQQPHRCQHRRPPTLCAHRPRRCRFSADTAAQEVARWQCATATREAGYVVQKGSEAPVVHWALRPWMRREVSAGASTTHRPSQPAQPARRSCCGTRPGHQHSGVRVGVIRARCGAPRFRQSRRRYGLGSRRGFQEPPRVAVRRGHLACSTSRGNPDFEHAHGPGY